MNPPPPPQLVVNLPPLPPSPDFATVNVILAALAVVLALTTVMLAVFGIIAAIGAIWGKNELKVLILNKAAEVAETAAIKRHDAYILEREQRTKLKEGIKPPAEMPMEGEGSVGKQYPGEGAK